MIFLCLIMLNMECYIGNISKTVRVWGLVIYLMYWFLFPFQNNTASIFLYFTKVSFCMKSFLKAYILTFWKTLCNLMK